VNRLCAQHEHITDWSTAARTMLFNVNEGCWDSALCDLFNVPMDILPEVRASDDMKGTILINGHEIPLLAGILDTSAGLFGSACLDAGEAKIGFGTCASLWVNAGARRPRTANLNDAIAWNRSGSVCYAVEAEAPAGAILTWACAQLGLAGSAAELVSLAADCRDEGQIMLVPSFTGFGAPYWEISPGAALFGIRFDTTKADIARACLDAIAFSLADAVEAIRDGGHDAAELRVDGGLSKSDLLMQRCADATGIPLVVGSMREATCFGAAALAALAAGEIDGLDSVRTAWSPAARFEPFWTDETLRQRRGAWQEAVAAVRGMHG
jgi:glycerol kinase